MKPVAVYRHAETEGPGYFATFLDQRAIPMKLIKIDEGVSVPADASEYSGHVFMGGPMSVNDDLPWIPQTLDLIREAVAQDIPVLGHCLGGQLMAKALGGSVCKNPVKEIGWGEVSVVNNAVARQWFGDAPATFEAFHWHGETFTVPEGAIRILESRYCSNQAFAMGKHMAMQCHVEMTAEMVKTWCEVGADEVAENPGPGVQLVAVIQQDLERHVQALNARAAGIYSQWIKGLAD